MKNVALLLVTSLILLVLALGMACNGVLVTGAAWADAECDTTRFVIADQHYIKIRCTVTVYVEPDWGCIKKCLEIKGLGHWEECLEGCLEE